MPAAFVPERAVGRFAYTSGPAGTGRALLSHHLREKNRGGSGGGLELVEQFSGKTPTLPLELRLDDRERTSDIDR